MGFFFSFFTKEMANVIVSIQSPWVLMQLIWSFVTSMFCFISPPPPHFFPRLTVQLWADVLISQIILFCHFCLYSLLLFKGIHRAAAAEEKGIIHFLLLTHGAQPGGLCVTCGNSRYRGVDSGGFLWFNFVCLFVCLSSGFHRGAAEAAPGCTQRLWPWIAALPFQ